MILAGDFIPKTLGVKLPDEFRGQLVLANLEGPICDDGLPTSNKVGVCLYTSRELFDCSECSIVRLKGGEEAPRFAFSLANNHIMDFREEGLRQTKEVLDTHDIPYAGAATNEEGARKPMILEEDGHRIAVFSCCERQFGMATRTTTGCADKGPWLYTAIQNVKSSCQVDFVIVSCHAANEYSPWVSPELHDFYHSLIDSGADCIHGHHAHVPQGYEEYKGKPIFYGLGNFVVDAEMWKSNPNQLWSVVADVRFATDGVTWSVKPYCVRRDDDVVNVFVSEGNQSAWCNDYLSAANWQFEDRKKLVGCWQESSVRLYRHIYEQTMRAPSVTNHRISLRDAVRKLMFVIWDIVRVLTLSERRTDKSIRYGKVLYNYFNCLSHVETIRTALGVLTGSELDLRTAETARLADRLGV